MITKFKAGKYLIPVTMTRDDDFIYLQFPYSKALLAEIKVLEGAKWLGFEEPPRKIWRIDDSPHNRFRLDYLTGGNPYSWYDNNIIQYEYTRPLYVHQKFAADFLLSRRQAILAAEMGCVDGDTIVIAGDGKGRKITVRDLYFRFHDSKNPPKHILTIVENSTKRANIYNVMCMGVKETITIYCDNGSSITLTPDHKINCGPDRWKEARSFVPGDIISSSTTNMIDYVRVERVVPAGDREVFDITCVSPFNHFLANGILVHNCGKTLAAIETMERSGTDKWWWVGPRSALKAIEREFRIWDCKVNPQIITYNKLVTVMKNWEDGQKAPIGIVFDESQRLKSPTSQRSQAAELLANGIRSDYGNDGYVILMSGAPAPKSPLDWFMQAKIACPGFLREGNYSKFRDRLAIIKKEENPYGQAYPKIVSWYDDSKKCAICGRYQKDHSKLDLDGHAYQESVNEVEKLGRRLSGLVTVQWKKDCLDLPDKIYRQIELQPSKETLDIAKALVAGASTTAKGLILLRELSDGFQYSEKKTGEKLCTVCNGTGRIGNLMKDANIPDDSMPHDYDLIPETLICDTCGGSGQMPVYSRDTIQVDCPKVEALVDLLDEYSDVGRVVIYAGFTGSVDRCVDICKSQKWNYIQVDGRGWISDIEGDHLTNFQDELEKYPRVAFIGQPDAAGEGLTLTASPCIIYYSNSFNGNSRIQSEDRIHRPGMDVNKGATIIDLLHLQSDYLVLENLKKKRELQRITLTELQGCLNG